VNSEFEKKQHKRRSVLVEEVGRVLKVRNDTFLKISLHLQLLVIFLAIVFCRSSVELFLSAIVFCRSSVEFTIPGVEFSTSGHRRSTRLQHVQGKLHFEEGDKKG